MGLWMWVKRPGVVSQGEQPVENTVDIKNTVSNMAIGQFKHTNDNTTKLVGTKEKQVNASKKNARGFKRVKRVIPVEFRNEQFL